MLFVTLIPKQHFKDQTCKARMVGQYLDVFHVNLMNSEIQAW